MFCALLSTISQFLFLLNQNVNVYFIILPCIFTGFCWAIGNTLCVVAAHDSVSKDKIGSATGMVYTFFNIGGSVVLAIATLVFKKIENNQTSKIAFMNGFQGALFVLLISMLVIVFITFLAKRSILNKST